MRCTTELTARSIVNVDDFHAIDRLFNLLDETEGCSDDFALSVASRMETEDFFEDALDYDKVPFETVADDLSMELYEQDCADDRQDARWGCTCTYCNGSDMDMSVKRVGRDFICTDCLKDNRSVFSDTQIELLNARADIERKTRKEKWADALTTAMLLRPDLNWAQYRYDLRFC